MRWILQRKAAGLAVLLGSCGAFVLAGFGAAPAVAAVVPPPGTPDLSQMVLQSSDFSHAGRIQQDGYTMPSPPIVASYARVFGPSAVGGTHFLGVESDAHLTTGAGTATLFLQAFRHLVRTKQGRQAFVQAIVQGANQAAHTRVLRARDVHFGRVHSLGVGDGSLILPAFGAVSGVKFSFDVVGVRVDRAFGVLFLGTLGNIRPADVLALARAIAEHMRTTLAAPPMSTTVQP